MFQIPQNIMENLKCSLCEGYLSVKPVVVMKGDKQVCGKCCRILPEEDKKHCVTQTSYEALCSIMIFPCKFNKIGCSYTFSWNEPNDHEAECPFRYFTFDHLTPYMKTSNKLKNNKDIVCENDLIRAHFNYEVTENKHDKEMKNLMYQLNIQGANGKTLSIKDTCNGKEDHDLTLNLEGALSLQSSPELIYSDIKVKSLPECNKGNIYETINNNYSRRAAENFNGGMIMCANKFGTCDFAQSCCINCNEVGSPNISRMHCKNYNRGCKMVLEQFDVGKHQNNCEFNDIRCPIKKCNFIDTLQHLKTHFIRDHNKLIVSDSKFNKKFGINDETIVIFTNENVFKLVYFYYETFIDFYVTFIGSSEKAIEYSFQISVTTSSGKIISKTCKCANWNDSMLAKGINFDEKELEIESVGPAPCIFEANVRILN